MQRVSRAILLVLTGLLVLSLAPGAPAEQLPAGVKVEVLGEMPSNIPGVEKIVMKRFTLAPGAKLENFTPTTTNL